MVPCRLSHTKICGLLAKKRLVAAAWIVAACALAAVWLQTPVALAQHGGHAGGGHSGVGQAGAGGHPNGGQVVPPHVTPPHAAVPPAPTPPISRGPVVFGQRAGFGRVGFGPRPIFIRGPILLRAPFFRLRRNLYPYWWVNCGSAWVWGFGCGVWRPPEYVPENYVTIYKNPVYVYYEGDRQFVELFLKDGTVYGVSDYWFVNEQVHFTALEDGTKSVEEVIGLDELDVQKTIDVNTRRGFRVVRRDEPLEQYLRDHPNANAPLLEMPPKN